MKYCKLFRSGEKGFTLIELLIVIVILGVLAAAIVPNMNRFLGLDEQTEVTYYTVTDRITGTVYEEPINIRINDEVLTFNIDGLNIRLSGGWSIEKRVVKLEDGE